MRFTTDSTALFGGSGVLYRVTKIGENELRFTTEFSTITASENPLPYNLLLDEYYIGKYNTPLEVIPGTNGSGYRDSEVQAAHGNYRSFRLPVLFYFLLKKGPGVSPGEPWDGFGEDWERTRGSYLITKKYFMNLILASLTVWARAIP